MKIFPKHPGRALAYGAAIALLFLQNLTYPQGAATSSESNNPFNQFSNSNGGVNLYSGDVYLPQQLFTLPGRNGMDVDLSLSYSSNIYLDVLARNDKAPTGWLGLGWELKLGGKIYTDHNNTVTPSDDKYYYTSPEGITQRIYENNGSYFLEREPYWRVTPTFEGTKRITGWTLKDPSGKIFRYGDFVNHNSTTRNATRYVFSWEGAANNNSNFVGEGFAGTPELYAFQWDLAEIEDLAANKIKYEYEQTLEQLRYKDWMVSNPLSYTKASYMKRITNPEGATIEFSTKKKDLGEVYDPKNFSEEPDAFMEFYEDVLLQKIQIKNPKGDIIREFQFCYKLINDVDEEIPGFYKKSLLLKVSESGANSANLGNMSFEYYDDPTKRQFLNSEKTDVTVSDYNFGALKSVTGKLCGKVTYEYKRKDINVDKASPQLPGNQNFGSDFSVKGGITENGNEYIVVGNNDGRIWVYNWESGQWKPQDLYNSDGKTVLSKNGGRFLGQGCPLPPCQDRKLEISNFISAGQNTFVLQSFKVSSIGSDGIQLFHADILKWNGDKWVLTQINPSESCYNNDCSFFPFEFGGPGSSPIVLSYMVSDGIIIPFAINSSSIQLEATKIPITALTWNGSKWDFNLIKGQSAIQNIALNGNKLLVETWGDFLPGNDFKMNVYDWNGENWTSGNLVRSDVDRDTRYVLGNGFIGEVKEEGLLPVSHYVSAWNWSGIDWTRELSSKKIGGLEAHSATIPVIGSGYFAAKYDGYAKMRLFQWNGEKWNNPIAQELAPNGDYWTGISSGSDFFLATYPRVQRISQEFCPCFGGCCFTASIPVWVINDAKVRAYNWNNNSWNQTDWGSVGEASISKKPKASLDFFVHTTAPSNAFVWNGSSWVQEGTEPLLSEKIDIISANVFAERKDGKLIVHRKFQNSVTRKAFSFVVSKKTIEDPITGKEHVFSYDYDSKASMYDTRSGTSKFNQVTVTIPNHGKEIHYYFNDFENENNEQKNINPDFDKLDGLSYKDELYDIRGKKVSEQNHSYSVFRGGSKNWPQGVFDIRSIGLSRKVNGVVSTSSMIYDEGNGLPSQIIEENSDGKKRITVIKYAFEVNSTGYADEMQPSNHNMLKQVAETAIYRDEVLPGNVLNASVTTWEKNLGGNGDARFPFRSYVWNRPASSTEPFTDFDFSSSALTNQKNWDLSSEISKYDSFGHPIETRDANSTTVSAFFGRGGTAKSVEVLGALHNQSAILTGDYSDNETNFDVENGWQKGGASLSTDVFHYGAASIHVEINEQGPTKSLVADLTRDYVFSAWVYPISVSASSPVVLSVSSNGSSILPSEEAFGNLHIGVWQKIERTLPKANLGTGALIVKVSSRGNSNFYVDDIRFHPKGALITTNYFNPKFSLPVATVSPSRKADYLQYDDAGRITAGYVEDENGNRVKTREIDYSHISGCSLGAAETGRLANATLSSGVLDFDPSTHLYENIAVANSVETVSLNFAPENKNEIISTNINGAGYVSDCCNSLSKISVPLSLGTNTVLLKVGNGTEYVFKIKRLETCWAYQGGSVSGTANGLGSAIGLPTAQTFVAYKNERDGKLYVKKFINGLWQNVGGAISDGEANDISLKVYQGVPYVGYLDSRIVSVVGSGESQSTEEVASVVIKKMDAGGWVPVGGLGTIQDGIVSKGAAEHLAFDIAANDGTPWVAFVGDPVLEDNISANQVVENRIYARKLSAGKWVPAGDFIPAPTDPNTSTHGDGIQDGIVSEFPANAISLAVSADGIPYIAYAGRQMVVVKSPSGELQIKNSGKVLIVKKLRTIGGVPVWASLEDEINPGSYPRIGGDIINSNNPDRVILSFSGTRLFIAYDYEYQPIADNPDELDGNRFLIVREFKLAHSPVEGTHWIPLPETVSEIESRILKVDSKSDYQFMSQNGIPKIVFTNQDGKYRVTAIQYDESGGKWKSIGIPGFTQGSEISQEGNLSIASNSNGESFVSFRSGQTGNSDRDSRISLVKYNSSCVDPTLSKISLTKYSDQSQIKTNMGFEQFYTQYQGFVDYTTSQIQVSATPNTCADIGKIVINLNGERVSSKAPTSDCSFSPQLLNLQEGLNNIEVIGMDNQSSNTISYKYKIYKEPNPTPSDLIVETVPNLSISPNFSASNNAPYAIEDVAYNQRTIGLKATFPGNTEVSVNGKPVGSGEVTDIGLQVGSNQIVMNAKVGGGEKIRYSFNINRLQESDGTGPLNQIVLFKRVLDNALYIPVSKSANYHELFVTSDNSTLLVVRAPGNTCATTVNGEDLGAESLVVQLPGDVTNLFVQRKCPDKEMENHFVEVHKIGNSIQKTVIGHKEGSEPEGFYSFSDLEEAYTVTKAFIGNEPEITTPPSLVFYVIADQGTDLVNSHPVEMRVFEKSGRTIPLVIIGILKGSARYHELLESYNSQLITP